LDGLQILWLLANPLWTHGIGESRSKTLTVWLLVGAAAANHIYWFITNPYTGSLLHVISYRICTCILVVQIWVSFNADRCLIGNQSTLMD